jgi:hypothetical protein
MVPMALPKKKFITLVEKMPSSTSNVKFEKKAIFIAVFQFLFAMVVVLPINLTGGKDKKRIRKDFFQQRSAREEPNNSSSSNYPDHRQLHPGLHHRIFVLQEPKKNQGRTSNQNCHDQRTSRIMMT